MDEGRILNDPENFQRNHLLIYRLMGDLNGWLARLSRRSAPFPRRAVPHTTPLILALALTSVSLLSLLIFQYNTPVSAWVHLYLGGLIFMLHWSAETIIRKVIKFLLPAKGKQRKSRLLWKAMSVQIKYQYAPGVALAIFGTLILPVLFQEIFHEAPGLPLYALAAVTGFVWGTGAYISSASSIVFVRYLSTQRFHLYEFNPQKSPIINALSEVFETALWVNSVSMVFLLLPLMFVERTPLLTLTVAAISVAGFGVLLGLFFDAQARLGALVKQQKAKTTAELQNRIETFYIQAEHMDGDTFGELQNLISLHDQVISAGRWGLASTNLAGYLRSFILPTLVVIQTNRQLIEATYNSFVQWWFN